VDYDVWGEEDEKTIKFSLLFQIICGSERTFSRSERRAEKKRKKRRLASGPLFFAKEKREERVLEDRKTASSDERGSFSLHNYPAFYLFYYIYIVKKVCRKYAERKSLIPTFEMRTLKLKRSTQYCRLMAMRTIVGKPLDSTNNPRI
jgi:hypothetical protein